MPIIWSQVTTRATYRVVRHPDEQPAKGTLLYAHLSRVIPPDTAPELLYGSIPGTLRRRIDRVALQVHPATFDVLVHPDGRGLIDDFCGRLEVDRLDLVTWDLEERAHRVTYQYAPGHSGPDGPLDESKLIGFLRTADFRYVASMSGARLPDTPHFHYEGPNGSHYTSFLRPGFSLSSLDDLESICFWLGPIVPPGAVIVVDTWNIASLGLALVNYAQMAHPSRPPGSPLPFVCVESYGDDPRALADHIDAIRRSTGMMNVFFVISISGSGGFAHSHQSAFSEARLPCTFVSLFATDPGCLSQDVLVMETVADIRRFEVECERCLDEKVKSPVIRVLPRSYLLELSGAVTRSRISKAVAQPYRDFFRDIAPLPGAVTVHRDQHDGQRHHAIHFDVSMLLQSDSFKKRCREIAARVAPRGVRRILCPDHPGAISLAQFYAALLEVPFTPVDERFLLERIATDPLSSLVGGGTIAVVDDVAITGHRLAGYQRALHDCGLVAHSGGIEFLYMVGVARPPTAQALMGLRDMAPERELNAVVELLIPDWQDNVNCPWCIEKRLLEDHPVLVERYESLRHRYDHLCSEESGLRENLFLRWKTDPPEWRRRVVTEKDWEAEFRWLQEVEPRVRLDLSWDLGPGSVFGAPAEVPLFITVAGAVQTLRSSGELHDEDYQLPLAKVLDPYLYMRGRFYDPVVVAAILRAVSRHDVRATAIEKLLRRAVGEKLVNDLYQELRSELMLAIGTGKLPRPVELRQRALFAGGDPGQTAFLRALTGGRTI